MIRGAVVACVNFALGLFPARLRRRLYVLPVVDRVARWVLRRLLGEVWERPVVVSAGRLEGGG